MITVASSPQIEEVQDVKHCIIQWGRYFYLVGERFVLCLACDASDGNGRPLALLPRLEFKVISSEAYK